jgi:hypothetical protein
MAAGEEGPGRDPTAALAATVVRVFLVCLPLGLVALLVLSVIWAESAPEAARGIVEILKTVLLPVVTLVLGYVFGRQGRGGG